MAQLPLPPPVPSKDPQQDRWLILLWKRVNSAGQILWSFLDFTGSDLADLETRNHADLQNVQGGSPTEQYHLTAAEESGLTGGADTTLHFHDADRDLANATGQLKLDNAADMKAFSAAQG
jgi:hypothetical protein